MKYERIIRAVFGTPWAIQPDKAEAIADFLADASAGISLPIIDAARPGATVMAGSVAVLPLLGVITQRVNMMSDFSGGTSTEMFGRAYRQALADPSVTGIVLDIDSPGGSVSGTQELAAIIRSGRGQKRTIAVANSLAASAAYWIGTAADELWVTPSGEVGSVGVIAMHEDLSRALDAAGVTVSLITAGAYKGEGNPYQPLDDDARGYLQARVDEAYTAFVRDLAKHRGVSTDTVRRDFGQGRVLGARAAVAAGMADTIGTLDDAIQSAGKPRRAAVSSASRARAMRLAGILTT